jgi:hypothetical protein
VPVACPAVLAVDVKDRFGADMGRHGRVRNERAQEPCEGLMLGLVEMALAAEKDDAMAQQGIANRGNRLGRQIPGQSYTVDFRTDRGRHRAHIEGRIAGAVGTCRRGRFVHELDPLLDVAVATTSGMEMWNVEPRAFGLTEYLGPFLNPVRNEFP